MTEFDPAGVVPVGAVLCGGQSSRFGRDKALAEIDGTTTMGAVVITALRDGGCDPVMAIGGTAGATLGVPTVPDRHPGAGPLAALATALRWTAQGSVVVVPCDLPLLTGDHVAILRAAYAAGDPDQAVIAVDDHGPQPQIGIWPASWGPAVAEVVTQGRRAWRAALDVGVWRGVALPSAALADADTEAALSALIDDSDPNQGLEGPLTP